MEEKINILLNSMTLEEKVSLCHGNSFFSVASIERLGIKELVLTDGPHGIRSDLERDAWVSLNREEDRCTYLPTEFCLGATWNVELARMFGETLGSEARYRNKDIVLGPGVNIIRTPFCGRNFEYISEDPCLTGRIASQIVKGIESQDVASCVKHYILNNQELDRFGLNVEVSKRALFEIYLRAFYQAIIEADASSVMGSYTKYKNQQCCHHKFLVKELLKEKWGFDGVYLTDWGGCHNTDEAIFNGLDIEMGTRKPYNEYYLADEFLEKAKKSEEVRKELDDKVRRILRLMFRINKMSPNRKKGTYNTKEHQKVAYNVAAESIVLLKNENNLLPIDKSSVKKLLVMGPNADKKHAEGGGSSGVRTVYEITPLEGIKNRFSGICEVEYASESLENDYIDIPVQCMEIIEKRAGVRAFRITSIKDNISQTEYCNSANLKDVSADSFDMECNVCIPESGIYSFRISTNVGYTFELNNQRHLSCEYDANRAQNQKENMDVCSSNFEKGEIVNVKIHLDSRNDKVVFNFGWMIGDKKKVNVWEKAKSADFVIYCGGLDHNYDTEGMDMKNHMQLPLEQNNVIDKLLQVNPNTIIVLTAGTPIEMPWIERAKAVLWTGYAGMEGGNALCDILTGDICPSGKLTVTLPYKYEDTPVARYGEYKAGNCKYNEDILVGYRAYDNDNIEPAFPFGHGLSYSKFEYSDLNITEEKNGFKVCFKVTNIGSIKAKEIVQVYIGDSVCSVKRPPKELRNFEKIELNVGESADISLPITTLDLSYFDEVSEDWKFESGEFTVFIGSSSRDIRLIGKIEIM